MIFRNKILVIVLILSVGLIVPAIFLIENQRNNILIRNIYEDYKSEYIDPVSFRVIDKQKNGITTSEGQSYGMLMSMWMNDQSTFDKVWKWTQDNLQKPDSNSFSWLWGKDQKGEYKIISEQGGDNVATDGDIDIAFALIKGSKKWNDPKYAEFAKKIITDIWNNQVVITKNGKYILASNDLEKKFQKSEILVNPSYFNPAAFKEFSIINSDSNWDRLIVDSYEILEKSSSANLDKTNSVFLPPDWISVNYQSGSVSPVNNPNFPTTFGFEAARTIWRVGLDYELNQSPLASAYLEKLNFYKKEWNNKGLLYTIYNHDGTVNGNYESKFAYSTSLGYFKNFDKSIGSQIVNQKLNRSEILNQQMSYYDSSWVFFGLGLYHGYLT